jgi:hypothetical protein
MDPSRHQSSTRRRASLVAALLLLLLAAPAVAGHISIDVGHDDIRVDGEEVVITADDDREAHITRQGELIVEGHRIRLDEDSQRDLIRYNVTLRWLERRAVDIGLQGAGLAISAIGEAIAAVASGDGDRAERRVEAKAERIKDDARELCVEVHRLEEIQNRVASRVPAFRPYAVIELDDDDCRVDD